MITKINSKLESLHVTFQERCGPVRRSLEAQLNIVTSTEKFVYHCPAHKAKEQLVKQLNNMLTGHIIEAIDLLLKEKNEETLLLLKKFIIDKGLKP